MKVKLTANLSGPDNIHGYVGDLLDLPAEKAAQLIRQGYAVAVKEERTAHDD